MCYCFSGHHPLLCSPVVCKFSSAFILKIQLHTKIINKFTNITSNKLQEMTNYNKTNIGHQKFVWRRIFLQEELSQ